MSLFESASLVVTPNGTKASKLYAIKPTSGAGDLSVTRATTATRVNSAGLIESVAVNVPRLDYTNGSCPSILVEPQRTNLLTYSEDFTNAAWNKNNVTITANSTASPDGNLTADTLTKSSTGVDGSVVRTVSATATGYVGSIFVKKDTNTSRFPEFFLRSSDAAGENEIYVQLNTSTGATSIRLQFGTVSVSAPVLINGYWRLSFYALANSNTCRFGIRPAAGTTLGVYNANATGSIIAWGSQLEAGSYATSYIPTVASSVTRNADVISKTGISSLIGQTEGTIFVDTNISIRSNTRVLLDVQDGTNNDTFQFILGGNTLTVNIYDGGNLQASLNGGYCLGRKKIALGYKANDFVLYIDGVQVATDTNGTVPTASLMALGYLYIASGYELGDTINSSALWKTRLTNAELAEITTL